MLTDSSTLQIPHERELGSMATEEGRVVMGEAAAHLGVTKPHRPVHGGESLSYSQDGIPRFSGSRMWVSG